MTADKARLSSATNTCCFSTAKSEVHIPQNGTILTRGVSGLLGRYVQEGQALFEIGIESQKELQLSVSQDAFNFFAGQLHKPINVYVRSPGCAAMICRLSQVNPRAFRLLKDSAIASANGGNLPVRPADIDSSAKNNSEVQWELLEPRFTATARLIDDQSKRLRAGQITTLLLNQARESIGEWTYRTVSNWLLDKFDKARRG